MAVNFKAQHFVFIPRIIGVYQLGIGTLSALTWVMVGCGSSIGSLKSGSAVYRMKYQLHSKPVYFLQGYSDCVARRNRLLAVSKASFDVKLSRRQPAKKNRGGLGHPTNNRYQSMRKPVGLHMIQCKT